jgi:hypothetical protein
MNFLRRFCSKLSMACVFECVSIVLLTVVGYSYVERIVWYGTGYTYSMLLTALTLRTCTAC